MHSLVHSCSGERRTLGPEEEYKYIIMFPVGNTNILIIIYITGIFALNVHNSGSFNSVSVLNVFSKFLHFV